MKVLFVHPSVELYGADKILLYILEILNKDNEITVLLPKVGILNTEIRKISKDIKIITNDNIPIIHSKLTLLDYIKLPKKVWKLNKIFKKNTFDYIYCNTLATVLFLYSHWAKKRIIHIHEIIENKYINFAFSLLITLKTRNVICVSEHVRRNLFFSKNYAVIHNGIPDCTYTIKQSQNNKIKFVLPGRFMQKKGQWFLIDSIKLLPIHLLKQCEFYLYGSPPPNRMELENELISYINNSGLEKYVHILNFEKQIEKIYNSGDVLLIPSMMPDPFPTTVLEAMMFSKPYITTNNGGASEITEKQYGILIEPGDTEAFKNAILYFLENNNNIQKMGKLARKKYEEYLTLDMFKSRFIKQLDLYFNANQ